jgi:hypothetical protein
MHAREASVHFTAVLTAVWRRYGMLGRPVAQGRDGTAVRLGRLSGCPSGYTTQQADQPSRARCDLDRHYDENVLEIGPMHSDPLQTRRGLNSKATA